jgi:hypothetical protein
MIIGICGMEHPIPRVEGSHYRGWCEILTRSLQHTDPANQYKIVRTAEEINGCDKILVHAGLYYYGDLSKKFNANLFKGDLSLDEPIGIMESIKATGKPVAGIEYPLPWVEALDAMKKKIKTQHEFNGRIETLKDIKTIVPYVDPHAGALERNRKLIIGDSHSGSSWEPGFAVYRNDRETLHGALKRGLQAKIENRFTVTPHTLRMHYGNIDVRFHILLQPNPRNACLELCDRLEKQLIDLEEKWNCRMEIVIPHPIEPMERTLKVPKSVWYEGTRATGTPEERLSVRNYYRDRIRQICKLRGWRPMDIVQGDLLPESIMERPRSIHLSPAYYLTPMPVNKSSPTSNLSEFFT